MKGIGDLAMDLEAMAKAQDGAAGGKKANGEEAQAFLAALLDTPALKESGLGEADLAVLLEQVTDGEGLPEGGKGVPKELLALLAALGSGEGSEGADGDLDAEALLAQVDLEDVDAEATDELARADRVELLQALSALQEDNLDPEEWVEALHARLGDAETPPEEQDLTEVAAASAVALLGALDDPELEDGPVKRSMADQITREMRAGGLLGPNAAAITQTANLAGGGDLMGQGSGDQRQPGAEALLQAATGSSSSESGQAARGEFAATLAAAGAGSPGEIRSGSMQFTIQQPAGQSGFGQAVGERVTWMINENVQQARLQLNPPGLGPMDVKVVVGEQGTTVNFNAHTAAGREALEADLPRLREMLAEQGYDDVDVNVSQGEGEDAELADQAGAESEAANDETAGVDEDEGRTDAIGLVDQYA